MKQLIGADLFCGAGGFSAGAKESGAVDIVFGLNHWPTAIATHAANNRNAKHVCSGLDSTHPSECPPINILLASPPCQRHSLGSSQPSTESSRADAWDVMRWIEFHRPEWFVAENVPQFRDWGPLNKAGRPIKELKGRFFDAWIVAIQAAGYVAEYQVMNAADFGAPTARRRLVIIARRGRRAPIFPTATHSESQWIPFSSVLRPLLGQSITNRDKPLVPATLRRIRVGREKFGERFLIKYYGTAGAVTLEQPLPTITTKDRFALIIDDTYRLLVNEELAAAQGFRPDYIFCGKKKEVTCQIGNSVSPPMSRAICVAIAG